MIDRELLQEALAAAGLIRAVLQLASRALDRLRRAAVARSIDAAAPFRCKRLMQKWSC